ncbi:GlxA family transcriptional regulator [Burkholderia anthina]|uniref:GlxA family transcriptional regulator n=1 Tax=Burkholderia anthina TaxID=179879 RepID=UPI0037BF4BF5
MMQSMSNISKTGLNVSRGRGIGIGRERESVIVLLLDGFSVMQMGKLAAVFEYANQLNRARSAFADRYELRLYSAHGGPVRSSSGGQIWTDAPRMPDTSVIHAMFVLGGEETATDHDTSLVAWLHNAHRRASVVKGASGGCKLLASIRLHQKGLGAAPLTSCMVDATSGANARADSTAVDEGMLSTALSIVAHDMGYEIAQEIVTNLMPGSTGKLTGAAFGPREARASELIRAATHHLRVNSANRISIADAAQAAAMSERNFLRRFKNEIGVTPTEFVLRVRLEKACCMLVETDLPADKVARRTGLGSGDRLAKLFRQHLSMSPTEYRAAARKRMDTLPDDGSVADVSTWMNGSIS